MKEKWPSYKIYKNGFTKEKRNKLCLAKCLLRHHILFNYKPKYEFIVLKMNEKEIDKFLDLFNLVSFEYLPGKSIDDLYEILINHLI